MSRSLRFLHHLLSTSSTVERSSILADNLFCDEDFLTGALEEDPYDAVYRTDLYEAGEEEHELRCESDSVVNGPNTGWVWSTDNKVYIFYFEVHEHILREWAYVRWDYDRLNNWEYWKFP
jgi:hypothetical protein